MSIHRKHRKKKRLQLSPPGATPGLVITAPGAYPPIIDLIAYGPTELFESRVEDLGEVQNLLRKFPVTWVNIDGLGDAELVKSVGEMFGFHRLSLEDVVNGNQRAKLEHYGDHHFIVTRMLTLSDHIESEQLSTFVGRNFVVTFQEIPGDCLEPVRARIRGASGKIRTSGPDYLVYALLDAVIDSYFPILERFGERMDVLEDEILEGYKTDTISRIHHTKRELLALRRAVWPLRDMLNTLLRDGASGFTDDTRIYLRDCYDHVVRIIDLTETYRELASDLMDLYLSMASHRLNEVMKVLTIISTIFIPLTFVVGVYGMNFDPESSPWNMPELRSYYGYPLTMAFMLAVAVALLFLFRRMGWLGSGSKGPLPPVHTGHH